MTGDHAPGVRPLLPEDPRRLGRYELVGRLGEGGMGIVFLGRTPDGGLVAVKMIRTQLAADAEFRRRFRGEVERARQVPPFCTAEVLDADPDHEHPYLVVEYVDGPSLAAVVAERGPLTPANLHGLAIGVATALTAIHGAGVIHRDLKPSNVLLAPGNPKVIDFGIARAVAATSGNTRTGQLLGSVPYMAPERFGSATNAALTPAADIFAWGAVVAYAGTGRTPFGGDSPHALAARILTQQPELDGLTGPLRELVAETLAKDPADRPTARELLDHLLTAGPRRSQVLAAALADAPELLSAAEGAQAATEYHPFDEVSDDEPLEDVPTGATTRPFRTTPAPTAKSPTAERPGAKPPAAVSQGAPAAPATPVPAVGERTVAAPTATFTPAVPAPRSGRWSQVATIVLALAVVAMAVIVVGIVKGVVPLAGAADPKPSASSTPTPTVSSAPSAAPTRPVGAAVVVSDPLTTSGTWSTRDDSDAYGATCLFDGALVVTKLSTGPYRCPGIKTEVADFTAYVDVKLVTPGSCAAIWFRFVENGYALRICPTGYYLTSHGAGDASVVKTLHAFAFDKPLALGVAARVGITASGNDLTFYRDGWQVGTWRDATFHRGRIVLGVFQEPGSDQPPFRVSFSKIEIWKS